MKWTWRSIVPDTRRGHEEPQAAPAPVPRFTGPPEYRVFHKYLRDRFADTVVLTFAQIEDLLGFALPDVARLHLDWWATADEDPSAQSRTWSQASRTAVPNLLARTVMFDRVSV